MYQDARGSGCFGGMTPWRYPNYPPAGPEPAHAAPRRLRHHRSVALHRRLAGHYRRNPYLLRPHRLRPHRGFAPPALQRRSRGRRNTGPGAAMAAMAGPPQAGKRVDPTPMGALALRRSVTPPPSERSDEMRADEGREVGRGPDAEIPPAPFPKHERRRQFWLSPCGTDMHHARGSQSEKAAESSDLRWLASRRDAKYMNQAASGRFINWLKRPVFRHFPLTLAQVDSGWRNPTVGTIVGDIEPAPTIKIAAPHARPAQITRRQDRGCPEAAQGHLSGFGWRRTAARSAADRRQGLAVPPDGEREAPRHGIGRLPGNHAQDRPREGARGPPSDKGRG